MSEKKKLDLNKIKELIEKKIETSKSRSKSGEKGQLTLKKKLTITRGRTSSKSSSKSREKSRSISKKSREIKEEIKESESRGQSSIEIGMDEDMTKVVFDPMDKGIELSTIRLNLEGNTYDFLLGRSGNLYIDDKDNELIGKLRMKEVGKGDVYMCEGWRTKLIK